MAVCPNKADPIYQYMLKKGGKTLAMETFIQSLDRIPETIEEADVFLEQFQTQENQADALSQKDFYRDIVENLQEERIIKDPASRFYKNAKTGEIVSRRVTDLVSDFYRSIGVTFDTDLEDPLFYADKGTVIHEYLQFIMTSLSKKETPKFADSKNYVLELKKLSAFKNRDDSFFDINQTQFKVILEAGKDIISLIEETQKAIDPKGEHKIFTEIPIYDEEEDRAGTVDLLVVYSDGSASIFDYKTFSRKPGVGPSPTKIRSWDVQISAYKEILKKDYGVTMFRHARVIPFNVSFYGKSKATGEYENQVAEGFQRIAAYNKKNNLDYLKPITFGERTEDPGLNNMLDRIQNRLQVLDQAIATEQNNLKKRKLREERARLYGELKKLERDLDLNEFFNYVTEQSKFIKNALVASKRVKDPVSFTEDDVLNNLATMNLFEQMYTDLKSFVESKKDPNLLKKLRATNTIILDTIHTLESEIVDNVMMLDEDIRDPGEVESYFAQRFDGLSLKTMPVFRKVNEMYTFAKRRAYLETEKQIKELQKLDKDFRDWASANGINQSDKFNLLITEDKLLESQYTVEFYRKFKQIRDKAFKEGKVSIEDKKWIEDNYNFNEERFKKDYYDPMKESLEKDFTLGVIKKDVYDKRIKDLEEKNPLKNKAARFESKFMGFFEPKTDLKTNINPKWQYIQDNAPLKAYYDYLKSLNAEFTSVLGRSLIGDRFLPNVQQTLIEQLSRGGLKDIKTALKRNFGLREVDDISGRTRNGEAVKTVPIFFVDDITVELTDAQKKEVEEKVAQEYKKGTREYKDELAKAIRAKEYEVGRTTKSTDLTSSYTLFLQTYNNYIEFTTIEPMLMYIRHLMYSKTKEDSFFKEKLIDEKGIARFKPFSKTVETRGISEETKKVFDGFVDSLIYQRRFDKELFTLEVGKSQISGNKLLTGGMRLLSIKTMAFDLILSASQALQVFTNMGMIGKEGRYFDKKLVREAANDYAKHDERFKNLVEYLVPTTRDLQREKSELSRSNKLSKWLTTRTFFLTQIKPTEMVENLVAVSMAKQFVVDSDGRIKNPKSASERIINKNAPTVYDSIKVKKDGSYYIMGVGNEAEVNKFRNKIIQQNSIITGSLSPEQMGVANRSIWMTMFLQFRTWIFPLLQARFRTMKLDPVMEEIEVGRYNLLLSALHHGFSNTIKGLAKITFEAALLGLYTAKVDPKYYKKKFDIWLAQNPEYLKKYSKSTLEAMFESTVDAKVRGAVSELRTYFALFLLLSAAKALDWDDEEESNFFTWNTYRIASRGFLESSFWLQPRSVNEVIRSPLPLSTLLSDSSKISNAIARDIGYYIKGERDSNAKPSSYYIIKNIPVANQVADMFGYFEQYTPSKGAVSTIFDVLSED
jgi:hypothetical protein